MPRNVVNAAEVELGVNSMVVPLFSKRPEVFAIQASERMSGVSETSLLMRLDSMSTGDCLEPEVHTPLQFPWAW